MTKKPFNLEQAKAGKRFGCNALGEMKYLATRSDGKIVNEWLHKGQVYSGAWNADGIDTTPDENEGPEYTLYMLTETRQHWASKFKSKDGIVTYTDSRPTKEKAIRARKNWVNVTWLTDEPELIWEKEEEV